MSKVALGGDEIGVAAHLSSLAGLTVGSCLRLGTMRASRSHRPVFVDTQVILQATESYKLTGEGLVVRRGE